MVGRPEGWKQVDEDSVYAQALDEVLKKDEGRSWAEGNIRIGDYLLLVDCDTRVPVDCLMDGVSELEQSPEVALLQFTSRVMMVSNSFFEKE